MVQSRTIIHAAALGIAVVLGAAGLGGAAGASPEVRCTGTPPQYNPGDLNYKHASVSAASRLALAIRWRAYLATCHRVAPRPGHSAG